MWWNWILFESNPTWNNATIILPLKASIVVWNSFRQASAETSDFVMENRRTASFFFTITIFYSSCPLIIYGILVYRDDALTKRLTVFNCLEIIRLVWAAISLGCKREPREKATSSLSRGSEIWRRGAARRDSTSQDPSEPSTLTFLLKRSILYRRKRGTSLVPAALVIYGHTYTRAEDSRRK